MPFFFSHARGAVTVVRGPWAGPPQFRIAAQGLQDAPRTRSIITQAGVRLDGNFQFVHTIDDDVFVYVFGDKAAELTIGGVAFANPCAGGSGIDDVIAVYRHNRLAVLGRPVIVAIGFHRFQSFLTGMDMQIVDAETQLGQFSYRLKCFDIGAIGGLQLVSVEGAPEQPGQPIPPVPFPTPDPITGIGGIIAGGVGGIASPGLPQLP